MLRCFCGSMLEPKALRMSTPHSCGASCSRIRESGCGHPCPLRCHPGPCPPCQVTTQLPCYCPRQTTLTFRCGADSRGNKVPIGKERNLSCGQVCGRKLNCGLHLCEKICHAGNCGTCEAKEEGAKCFCGKETRGVVCGQGERLPCFVEGSDPWVGRFGCDGVCGRYVSLFAITCLWPLCTYLFRPACSTVGFTNVRNHVMSPHQHEFLALGHQRGLHIVHVDEKLSRHPPTLSLPRIHFPLARPAQNRSLHVRTLVQKFTQAASTLVEHLATKGLVQFASRTLSGHVGVVERRGGCHVIAFPKREKVRCKRFSATSLVWP